jgi:hypothetical protein
MGAERSWQGGALRRRNEAERMFSEVERGVRGHKSRKGGPLGLLGVVIVNFNFLLYPSYPNYI